MVAEQQRKYQIVVIGATGFTGKRVAKEIVDSGFKGTFALAGRDNHKLKHLASSLRTNSVGILLADVNHPPSLNAMAAQAHLVINCVGPFRFYGQPVVAACISQKTSYLDICGEPEFIEKIELLYHKEAAAAGIYIASAVGFDSVPGDLGSLWTARMFQQANNNNNSSICSSSNIQIETFISIKSGPAGVQGHYPTWESAVNGVGSAAELAAIRKQAKQELFYHISGSTTSSNINTASSTLKLKRHSGPFWEKRLHSWALPFIGADASVIRRTMAMEASSSSSSSSVPQPQSAVYFTVPSLFYLLLFIIAGTVFQLLAQRKWGRRLLLNYPAFFSFGGFSHQGPSEEQLKHTTFEIVNFAQCTGSGSGSGSGTKKRPIVTSITGPEPGYISCAIFIVAAAIVVLEERDALPPPGIWTPGMLLIDTSYIERVRRRGVEFAVVSQSS